MIVTTCFIYYKLHKSWLAHAITVIKKKQQKPQSACVIRDEEVFLEREQKSSAAALSLEQEKWAEISRSHPFPE